MRRGWLLWALFCALILSGCGGVTGGLVTNPMACRPKPARPEATLPTYLLRLGATHVEKQKGDVSITLSSDSLFQPGVKSVELSNKTYIDVLAGAGKKYPHTTIAVDVYTDCIHTEEQNLALSQLEAWMIKQALVDCGIPSKRITAQGWGESRPVATNATRDGRKANRRVTITFERTNS
ncbi:MAG: OmpA family protein [Syntrophobacteraceae bacterium]|nr:OmpA family protein [Syntrophobacteraceae bacterium]